MTTNQNLNSTPAAADAPQTVPMLTPEEYIQKLRELNAQVPEVTPLTAEQRKVLRQQGKLPDVVIHASISVIGASETVTTAVRQPADEVHKMLDELARWRAAADELRAALSGIDGANLVRRQKVAVIAGQAYLIASQLARVPENAELLPHVEKVKRLKALVRRKKRSQETSQDPQQPSDVSMTPKA